MTKPEPSELERWGAAVIVVAAPGRACSAGRFLKNSSNRSSNGVPCCSSGGSPPSFLTCRSSIWVAEMLTTASLTAAASSASESGPWVAKAGATGAAARARATIRTRARRGPNDEAKSGRDPIGFLQASRAGDAPAARHTRAGRRETRVERRPISSDFVRAAQDNLVSRRARVVAVARRRPHKARHESDHIAIAFPTMRRRRGGFAPTILPCSRAAGCCRSRRNICRAGTCPT